ncbi:putative Fe-containing alcohol dehydrogenase [Mycena maculata]|uniref:Fe-containing alcohol dehydrogenase n=1 Tax=Mycena maculata TaxID=230809 RepID=A0AAD7HXF9_9AGAR|nr:putative Fe-containing alcohol dehydrogenase [Mycena maculata]
MPPKETCRPAVPPYSDPLPDSRVPDLTPAGSLFNNCDVSYGLSFFAACAKHAEETFHAQHVFIIASSTLVRTTDTLDALRGALGAKVVGVKFGLKEHTYFSDVIAIAEECRKLDVDLIVTLGGGTLSDAAKMVSLALANDITQSADLLNLPTSKTVVGTVHAKLPAVPVICIATTLSAGEFTNAAGVTDDRDNKKHQFIFGKAIYLVIYDAELVTAHTPLRLFLQSGFRSVDHCVESLCSIYSTELSEMHAKIGLAQLVPGLLRCRADDGEIRADVEARLLCQLASIHANATTFRVYNPSGGSHAIGHMLGPFGVGHGHTSGILLPAVCKYNARHGADVDRQEKVARLLWRMPEMRRLAESKGLAEETADLGDVLDILVRELGMPRTLAEVGVGRDRFEQLAEYSVYDIWAATNPVPLTKKEQVMEILEMVAE